MTLAFPELDEVEGKIADRRKQLRDIFAEAQPGGEGTVDLAKVKSVDGGKEAVLDAIRALNEELDALGDEQRKHQTVRAAAEHALKYTDVGIPGDDSEPVTKGREPGSVIKKMLDSGKSGRLKGVEHDVDVDLKTLFQTTAGWAPETTRSGLVVPAAVRPVQLIDMFPQMTWEQAGYTYMEETTFTNNAAETAEGGTYPESAFALTERNQPHAKVTHFVPVTDEQLEDVPEARAYLEDRLTFGLRQRVDLQLAVGNGTAPNMRGFNNVVGIQAQAKGADPTFDAILKAATKVKVTGQAMPSHYVTHPNDWQEVRLTRTVDGIYILGNPNEPGPTSIWGLAVVEAQAQTENTGVVADFINYSLLVWRRGINLKVSDSHGTFFVEGKQAMRADVRGTPVWFRPTAICTVTGI
jgi:HK97 family phage major capsid protein